MLRNKTLVICGALGVAWIVVLYLLSKLSTSPVLESVGSPFPREVWRQQASSSMDVGQIQSIEEKLRRDAGYKQHSFNVLVSERLDLRRELPDTRDAACPQKYNIPSNVSVSVIICFYNEHLQTLLRSVASVFLRTPRELLREIIVLDDFSDIHNERLFPELEALDPEGKLKIVRNSKRQGLIRSRVFGARLATGEILVFLDSHIEVNEGWIQPLIDPIVKNRLVVTVPVVDIINPDTFEYSSSPLVKGGFNWGLHFKWDPLVNSSRKPEQLIASPAMPGGLFAINRLYFKEIGEFDTGMDIWGGENIEFSIRLWTCGGFLYIVPCSRVGHVFRKRRPYGSPGSDDTILKNNLRLANVWLDDEYKEYFFQTFKNPPRLNFGDVSERLELRKKLNCKPFSWYHKSVYPDMQIPGEKSKYEPVVQPWYLRKRNYTKNFVVQYETSQLCLSNLNKKGESIKKGDLLNLQKCSNKTNQIWFLTDRNELLLNRLLCLEAGSNTSLNKCHESGADQEWTLLLDKDSKWFTIYNKATGMCLLVNNGKQGDLIDLGICGNSTKSAIWQLI